ncbi:MAG: TonB-dependent receptor [Candidatus Kapabacteria bacterium]|nr:TonB-dependent receptor [Candidatus Kapabacteria bacterium]
MYSIRAIACITLVLAWCSPMLIGQGVTTGTMSGTVSDKKTGRPLTGATVVAIHQPTGTKYGAISRKAGFYTIRGMRVGGPYTVTATYIGYAAAAAKGVTVKLGDDVDVDLALDEKKTTTDEVVVTARGDKIFDQSKTGAGSTIGENEIAAAPTINRSFSDIARINPYSNQNTSFGGDDGLQGISVGGQNSRYNNIQVDGAVANDMFGLGQAGTAGSQANANFLSLDAIQEMQVNVSPYDIRQSGFTGGLVNAITRSGTNQYKGSVFVFGRNQNFVGLSPDALRQPFADFTDYQFGGRIGGPIVENKVFFHVTGEMRLRNRPLELALNDPSALNNFPYPQSTIDEVSKIAREKYGYDAGSSERFVSRSNSFNIIARFDWNIDENNKLQFRHNFTNAFQDRNVVRTNRQFSLGSQWNEFTSINNSSVLQLNSILGSNSANELRIAVTQTNDDRVLRAANFPQVKIMLSNNESVVFGPERNSQANGLDQTQVALTNDFSYFMDEHTITIGTHNEYYRFNNLFITDYFGNYTFRDVQAFRDGTPSFYQHSYANLAVTGGDPMPRAAWSMIQTGLYVMDEWKVNKQFRLVYGLRADMPIYLSSPYSNSLFARRFDSLANRYAALDETQKSVNQEIPTDLRTDNLPKTQPLFSPRIGFNYDVLGDRSLQLRGGTGLFTGRVVAVWLSNQFSNTGVDLFRVQVGTDNNASAGFLQQVGGGNLIVDLNPNNPLRPGDGRFAGASDQTSAINLTSRDFQPSQVWRSTLATDIRIAKGISITAEGMYSASLNTVQFSNINLKRNAALPFSPLDNRPLYQRPPGTGRTDSNAAREFTQVIYLSNRNEGYQYSGMAMLNIDPSNELIPGLSFMLSYTRSAAFDLAEGTSATASSNWIGTDVIDPNKPALGRSNFDVPHRIMANISYRYDLCNLFDFLGKGSNTTIGLFYSGNSGRPFSFTYLNDVNGDNVTTNDLIYIPNDNDLNTKVVMTKASELDLRTSDQIWNQMMMFINENPVLRENKGKVLPRNSMREPFIHQLDLRLAQTIPTSGTQSIDITLDMQNVLNFLSSDWGLQRFVTGQSFRLMTAGTSVNNQTVIFDSQNRMYMGFTDPVLSNGRPGIYDTDNFFSRWRMQLGIRYNF